MKTCVFSAKRYEIPFLQAAADKNEVPLVFREERLDSDTAYLADTCEAILAFTNDHLGANTLQRLSDYGVKLIALRCAGFNNVDLDAAKKLGLAVVRVPAYSPYAVAEFAVALILALNRKIARSSLHTLEHNFSLNGLMGFDLHGKTVGIIGTGKIGTVFARIMNGFGCRLLAYANAESEECLGLGVNYVDLDTLYKNSDIISLHCPLVKETQHIINDKALQAMKDGVMIINTGRGALIDTKAVIKALKTSKIGYLGLDVYEEEDELFFQDVSTEIIQDDIFARLLTFPNVMITGHQAFFTRNAVTNIANTSMENIRRYRETGVVPPAEGGVI